MFTTQGPVNWDIARQFAQWTATGGAAEANVDPVSRVRLEELLRVAELHVGDATGMTVARSGLLAARTVTPGGWAVAALEAWGPLLEQLAATVAEGITVTDDDDGAPVGADPMSQMFANLPQMLGPMLFGMQSGSMVGQLGQRAMGQYDLPMPRPVSDELQFVPATIDGFAEEWSLAADDVRMWICLREVAYHAVLGRPHVRARLDELIAAYVGAFETDPRMIEERLGGLDPTDMAAMQAALSDPSALLGELRTDRQRQLQVPLRALLATVTGYVDHIVSVVGHRLITGYGPLTEALHRRRLEEHPGGRILGQLFGVELSAEDYERGQHFVAGVLERAGDHGLDRLWRDAAHLPTPPEVDAPGLWLARIELDLPPAAGDTGSDAG
jgi:putative hydrolase